MKTKQLIFKLLILSLVFASCSDDDDNIIEPEETLEVVPDEIPESLGDFENGILVSAEGNFQARDGSISFVNQSLTEEADNFIYLDVNGVQPGGLIQSVAFSENEAYIILNDVNTILVTNRFTMERQAAILEGLNNPRFMTIVGDTGYVTNWGDDIISGADDYIAVVDLESLTITDTIVTNNVVEQIVNVGNSLYVTRTCFSGDNTISVIDLGTNAVSEITVFDNPEEIFVDASDNLILLCEGQATFNDDSEFVSNSNAALVFIDTTSDTVTRSIEIPDNERATLLSYNNNYIYYYESVSSTVYEIEASSTTLPDIGIPVENIRGMTVLDEILYTVTFNFVDLSELIVYDFLGNEEIYRTDVGLGASKIYFN